MLTDDRRYSEVWWCSSSFKIFIYIQNRFKTGPSLCFPRIYMFLSASPRETLRFSRNRMNCFPRACKLWVDLSCFNHVKERKRRFQTGRNLPYTYQAMRCALAHKCNQYILQGRTITTLYILHRHNRQSSDLIKLISAWLNSVIRHCMTLTPTVAVDCCLKDDGLRLFLGLSSNNTLRLAICVYFIMLLLLFIHNYYYDHHDNYFAI